MIGPLSAAASGMVAQTRRLEASASNIANAETAGYVPQHVALSEGPGGGVVAQVLAPDPAEPAPRVDIEHEFVDRISAARAYEANLAVVKDEVERLDALFEAVG
jgi:flagellar basal body rod protein FlgC